MVDGGTVSGLSPDTQHFARGSDILLSAPGLLCLSAYEDMTLLSGHFSLTLTTLPLPWISMVNNI